MGAFIHCPSCGAPANGQFCEYCGTPLFTTGDSFNSMLGRRCHIWFEMEDGTIHCLDLFVNRAELESDCDTIYADDGPYMAIMSKNVAIEGRLLDFDMEDWKKVVEWQSKRWNSET